MGSLLFNLALLGGGFILGRIPLLPVAAQTLDELRALSTARKIVMAALVALLLALYVVGVLLPMRWIAEQEADKASANRKQPETTSFRRELRRRGSFSMSFVTDIKAHVFSRC
ncbi:hypothetical protein CCR75_007719 [Bremia lactucae]|uniref:Uncharacterized protein n=1 Tax=Bremia lactucae TaxID=4779 RepID=A0A976IJB5_BRELC|nr:hypothetical protein CCR75_007719 [Bremia lactucae]